MKPRVLQLFAAGVNCDRELAFAWSEAGTEFTQVHIRHLAEHPELLQECDVFSIPGGFTYGDDLGAGRILALELNKFLGDALHEFHGRGGALFGSCNGFQILVQMGLLPGVDGIRATLTWNDSHRFECRWTRLIAEAGVDAYFPQGTVLAAPSAHAEGKLVLGKEAEDLVRLQTEGLIALRYADADGNPTTTYPDCPNGSLDGIAGLISPSRRILGLMPHPERNLSAAHLPDRGRGAWGAGGEGILLLRNLARRAGSASATAP